MAALCNEALLSFTSLRSVAIAELDKQLYEEAAARREERKKTQEIKTNGSSGVISINGNVNSDASLHLQGVGKPFNALQSGLEAVNFVYGEVDFEDFQTLLLEFCSSFDSKSEYGKVSSMRHEEQQRKHHNIADHEKLTFVDLGCGAGVTVAAAALLSKHPQNQGSASVRTFDRIIGIDILNMKIRECRIFAQHIIEALQASSDSSAAEIEIIEGDFLRQEGWQDQATAVYTCGTCYTPAVAMRIYALLQRLRPGCKIMIMDRPLPLEDDATPSQAEAAAASAETIIVDEDQEQRPPRCEELGDPACPRIKAKYLGKRVCRTTWGQGDMLVYEKL